MRHRQAGFSYLEVLLSLVLLGTLLVPALEALRDAMAGPRVQAELVEEQLRLASGLEKVLALPYSNLLARAGDAQVPSALSEPATVPGRLLVYVSRYDSTDADGDGDPFSGGSEDLLWVAVSGENTHRRLTTLVAP